MSEFNCQLNEYTISSWMDTLSQYMVCCLFKREKKELVASKDNISFYSINIVIANVNLTITFILILIHHSFWSNLIMIHPRGDQVNQTHSWLGRDQRIHLNHTPHAFYRIPYLYKMCNSPGQPQTNKVIIKITSINNKNKKEPTSHKK